MRDVLVVLGALLILVTLLDDFIAVSGLPRWVGLAVSELMLVVAALWRVEEAKGGD